MTDNVPTTDACKTLLRLTQLEDDLASAMSQLDELSERLECEGNHVARLNAIDRLIRWKREEAPF